MIYFFKDPEPPTFTNDQSEESVVWYTGDVNKTISCQAHGKPRPTVNFIDYDTTLVKLFFFK